LAEMGGLKGQSISAATRCVAEEWHSYNIQKKPCSKGWGLLQGCESVQQQELCRGWVNTQGNCRFQSCSSASEG